jgi:hypothetical protein
MTYLYETLPTREGADVKHYEIQQNMNDMPLTTHPDTGEPIRRVILGGWGSVTASPTLQTASKGDCGCGPGGCC